MALFFFLQQQALKEIIYLLHFVSIKAAHENNFYSDLLSSRTAQNDVTPLMLPIIRD